MLARRHGAVVRNTAAVVLRRRISLEPVRHFLAELSISRTPSAGDRKVGGAADADCIATVGCRVAL